MRARSGSLPCWIATELRTIAELLRVGGSPFATNVSPNSHRTRSPPRSTESAASAPSQRGSCRNSASASGQASARSGNGSVQAAAIRTGPAIGARRTIMRPAD
jgi:hypothetical protein